MMPNRVNARAVVSLVSLLVGTTSLVSKDLLADPVVLLQPGGTFLSSPFDGAVPDDAGRYSVIRLEGRSGEDALAAWPGYFAAGKYEEALTLAERYLQQNPESGLAHEARGTALIMLRQFDKAQQALLEATRVEDGQSGPWVKLGMCQMENNELEDAEASLTEALAIDPANRFAHQRLAMLYDYLNRDQEAITHYRQGLIGAPASYVGVAVELGRLLNQAGRFYETIEVLEPRLPVDANLGQANFILARAYLGTARYADAQARFARAAELGVAPTESSLGIALSQRERGDLAAATQTINELIAIDPDAPLPYLERGTILLVQDKPALAARDFDTADRKGAGPLTGAKRLARYYADREEFEKGQQVLEKLVDNKDADPEVYLQLSDLYFRAGQQEMGLAALERGVGAYPDNSYLAYRTAAYLAATRQYSRSLSWFERALKGEPQSPSFMRAYSLALARAGELSRSAEVARDLYALRSDRPDVAVFYAARLEGAKRYEEAEALYRELLEGDPDGPLVLNNLASILARRDKYAEAEQYARRATALVPDNGRLLDTLGWVLYGKGDYGKSADILKKAASLEPELAVIQFHYGMAEFKAGDAASASAALSRALDLDSEASWASAARDHLKQISAPKGS